MPLFENFTRHAGSEAVDGHATLRLGYWDVLAADADADTGTHPLSTQEEIAEVAASSRG